MKIPESDRLLAEVSLEPVQGSRFQPTGFPSLGPAEFVYPTDERSVESLLVESPQSMANRLEAVCWNEREARLVDTLSGIPTITVNDEKGDFLTSSLLEAHRINSSYIIGNEVVLGKLKEDLELDDELGRPNMSKLAKFALKYDPNSILHGVFLSQKEIAGGRFKMTRSISAFIEATDVKQVISGGVKLDQLDPKGGDEGAKKGFGHIPYPRTEYAAKSIKAYFNIDLSRIRSYGLSEIGNEFLFTFALWKIQSFLLSGLRLRTACDLKIKEPLKATHPESFSIPDHGTLSKDLQQAINKCMGEGEFAKESLIISHKQSKKKKG